MSSDASAWQQQAATLYASHHGWLRGWLRRRLGNAVDAADLAHDTYVRILRSGRVPEADHARQLLTTIANGLVIDLYRRRQIEAAYLAAIAALPVARSPSEEERALAIEALAEIDAILQALPARVRTAWLLCKLDGLSYREIAGRLGVSVSSVEKYIATALVACYQVVHGDGVASDR